MTLLKVAYVSSLGFVDVVLLCNTDDWYIAPPAATALLACVVFSLVYLDEWAEQTWGDDR